MNEISEKFRQIVKVYQNNKALIHFGNQKDN
jgi:hypothetical protein